MTENIYYVGGQHQVSSHLSSNKLSHKVQLRENRENQRKMGREQNSNYKLNHNSRSTSCPKTERSSYAVTLQKLRNKSPKIQLNTLNIFKAKEPSKADTKVLTAKNSSSNDYSSAFQRISMRAVQKEKSKPLNLFKKVQQPRFRSKQQYRITDFNEYRAYTTQNKHQNQQKLGNIRPTINNTEPAKAQIQSQYQLQVDEHYKIQPLKKLFLCHRCYQFTPIIQLRAHHLSCRIPLNKEQFVHKWLKIINLLKEILRQKNTNQLYRLIDRMEWYISECKVGHREGYILYSQELACVLSLKESIKLDCVYVDDLFSLIETVGDLIETKSLDLDQTAFWKICH